jgi:hypothetical protein
LYYSPALLPTWLELVYGLARTDPDFIDDVAWPSVIGEAGYDGFASYMITMIKVSEYLAAARPVVAFRLTETENTAADPAPYAACGDLDHFASLVQRLAADSKLRSQLAARAARRRGSRVGAVGNRAAQGLCPALA